MAKWKSKAQTLHDLAPKIGHGRVLPLVFFEVSSWFRNSQDHLESIARRLGDGPLIVRSSALSEDGVLASNAGRYLSIANVEREEELRNAVAHVISSYGPERSLEDQVLVQPMAENIIGSGVATTRDHLTGLPYVVVNFSEANDTSIVTGGRTTMKSYTYLNDPSVVRPLQLRQLSILISELEQAFPDEPLEIEFGLDEFGVLLFQIRPLAQCQTDGLYCSKDALLERLKPIANDIQSVLLRQRPGEIPSGCFGVMPDWNPAEMIGLKPTPLAYSLYDELLMKRAWSEGRARYGYKDLGDRPLMYQFGGTPYIDICASLYSLLPSSLCDNLARKIVSAACRVLQQHTELHDKVEFALFPTCYAPDLHLEAAYPVLSYLTETERSSFESALKTQTNDMFAKFNRDLVRIDEIRTLALDCDEGTWGDELVVSAVRRLEVIRDIVAPFFSSVARAAFVGTAVIRGVHACGHISDEILEDVLFVPDAASGRVARDFVSLPKSDFLSLHGHIRPGTYDIRVPRYDEDYENYFSNLKGQARTNQRTHIRASPQTEKFLCSLGLELSDVDPVIFVRQSLWAREEVKYLYAKLLSDSLNDLVRAAEPYGFHREELAFLRVEDFACAGREADWRRLKQVAEARKREWQCTCNIRMPALLFHPSDIYSFEDIQVSPNFVTQRRILGPLRPPVAGELSGAIVLIEQADPGYDWIFSHSIAGLITAYGGSNSHMTVRAREFGIPAAIGVGGALYERLLGASRVLLACDERRIEILQ
ncbi:MAG: PEP-utilizing enzyme [Hyphomonas sp.]|uniref:PEP-utilizing enzyme n=1 Tax=Hyphomonas sp. TaxID=87 RepID=UPI0030022CBA